MPPVSAESIESSFFSLALAVLVVAVVAFVAVAFSLSIGGTRARALARALRFVWQSGGGREGHKKSAPLSTSVQQQTTNTKVKATGAAERRSSETPLFYQGG